MSRIEEGCMAIVIGGQVKENDGKIVTVGKFLGEVDTFKKNDFWEVSKPMTVEVYQFGEFKRSETYNMQSESALMRIDDTDTEKQTDHETEEEISK